MMDQDAGHMVGLHVGLGVWLIIFLTVGGVGIAGGGGVMAVIGLVLGLSVGLLVGVKIYDS